MKVITTSIAAKACGLSVKAILNACNSGDLKCHILTTSNHRRIIVTDLKEWMEKHNMSTEGIQFTNDEGDAKLKYKRVIKMNVASKLCGISVNTLRKLCDDGTLKSFKVPNSNHRRILKSDLREFMIEFNIPTDALDA